MDIALKTISPKQHDKNLENYNKHILLLEDKVRKNIDDILSIKNKKPDHKTNQALLNVD